MTIHKFLESAFNKFHQYLTRYLILPQIRNILPQINNVDNVMAIACIYETGEYIQEKMNGARSFVNRYYLLEYALSQADIEGMIMEFGVYRGESINYISERKSNRLVYGFDSFEGLPENWRPGFETGTFKLEHLPEVNDNVKLFVGYFDQSLPKFLRDINEKYCAFIHIDCDLYSSTKTVFSCLSPYIKKGTVIVFDEYFGYPGWKLGEFKAFKEYVQENKLSYNYIGYVNDNQQVAVKIT